MTEVVRRHLAPYMAVERSPRRFLAATYAVAAELAPLLEKVRHAGGDTLVAQAPRPLGVHWSGAGAALAACDHPVDAIEVEVQGREQRFAAQEADRGGDSAESVDARGPALILDANTHPHVGRPCPAVGELDSALWDAW